MLLRRQHPRSRPQVRGHGHDPVAHRVRERRVHDRAVQRLQIAHPGDGGRLGDRVQSDLRVVAVAVVEQEQCGPWLAHQSVDLRRGPGHLDLPRPAQAQAALVHLIERGQHEAVRAQRAVLAVGGEAVPLGQPGGGDARGGGVHRGRLPGLGGGGLTEGVLAGRGSGGLPGLGVVRGDLEPQLGGAARLQPGGRPRPHVAVRCGGVEGGEEVLQRRGAEGVGREVGVRTGEERVLAHVGDERLEDAGALRVGDAVEVELGGLDVRDVRDDRVRGGVLVLAVGPVLAAQGEADPSVVVRRRAGQGVAAHVVREGLLEPQVVPPRHRHEVAEPHVGHLVEDGGGAGFALGAGGAIAVDVGVRERDEARILHRAQVVLRHEDLVVLPPRVGLVEDPVEEVEALPGHAQDVLRVDVRGQRLPHVHAQRDRLACARDPVLPGERRVRAGAHAREVRGDRQGGGEPVQADRAVLRAGAGFPGGERGDGLRRRVVQDRPLRRGQDLEDVARLEVRLVEDRGDAAGVRGLVLGVEVGEAVRGIREAVHALAGAGVRGVRDDDEAVGAFAHVEADPRSVEHLCGVQVLPVEGDGVDPRRDEVDERGAVRARRQVDDRAAAEHGDLRVRGTGEVEVDGVAIDAQQRAALPGLRPRQVGGARRPGRRRCGLRGRGLRHCGLSFLVVAHSVSMSQAGGERRRGLRRSPVPARRGERAVHAQPIPQRGR